MIRLASSLSVYTLRDLGLLEARSRRRIRRTWPNGVVFRTITRVWGVPCGGEMPARLPDAIPIEVGGFSTRQRERLTALVRHIGDCAVCDALRRVRS